MHFRRNEACDLIRSDHVVGVLERGGRSISCRRDPFGIGGKQFRDLLGVAGLENLPGSDDNLFGHWTVHRLLQYLVDLFLLYKNSAPISLAGIGPDHLKAVLRAAASDKMSDAKF